MSSRQAVLGVEGASFFYGSSKVFEGVSFQLDDARTALVGAGFTIDYVALADAETLAENPAADRPRRLLAAARMGGTRLIDNIAIEL